MVYRLVSKTNEGFLHEGSSPSRGTWFDKLTICEHDETYLEDEKFILSMSMEVMPVGTWFSK